MLSLKFTIGINEPKDEQPAKTTAQTEVPAVGEMHPLQATMPAVGDHEL